MSSGIEPASWPFPDGNLHRWRFSPEDVPPSVSLWKEWQHIAPRPGICHLEGSVIAPNLRHNLLRIDVREKKKQRWTAELEGELFDFGIVGGNVLACSDGGLYCLDLLSGEVLWRTEIAPVVGNIPFAGGIMDVSEGTVCCGSSHGTFRKFELTSGRLISTVDTNATPYGAGGTYVLVKKGEYFTTAAAKRSLDHLTGGPTGTHGPAGRWPFPVCS